MRKAKKNLESYFELGIGLERYDSRVEYSATWLSSKIGDTQ